MLAYRIFGFVIIYIGLTILIKMMNFGEFLLAPLFLFGLGILFFFHVHRWAGVIFFILAGVNLLDEVVDVEIGQLLVALVFIFIGIRMLLKKPFTGKWSRRILKEKLPKEMKMPGETDSATKKTSSKKGIHESILIGEFHLLHPRFELNNMNISIFIGDIIIDLAKADIPDGETFLTLNCFIGDVDIYIPDGLAVSVVANVMVGDIDVLDRRKGGVARTLQLSTPGYASAEKRIKIATSVFIGDVDVREV